MYKAIQEGNEVPPEKLGSFELKMLCNKLDVMPARSDGKMEVRVVSGNRMKRCMICPPNYRQ